MRAERIEKLKLDLQNAVTFVFDVDEDTPQDDFDGTITQALMLMNGQLLGGATGALSSGGALSELMRALMTDRERIDALYLRTLSRPPSESERDHWLAFVTKLRPGRAPKLGPKQEAYEDLFWALLNSSEFVMRH
jgi:hypothetical protein